MELMKWRPTKDLFSVPRRFGTLLDDLWFPALAGKDREALWEWNPAVDVFENDDAIVVKAELPGVAKEDITVDVQGRTLTIKGERKAENEVQEERYYRKERFQGRFERAFTLPADVDPEAVKADYKDGVLKVEVPKPEKRKARKITVQ